ncbi:MAG: ornithine carbamoyltransferase, partial [Gemmatimonadetes bacterium]|nr:ornithine carbamoyltransferase [Gemmatimonadota bacterium]
MTDQTKRDFVAIPDLETDELLGILDRAHRMKAGEDDSRPLVGKTLAMIFRKSSTRTRVSFEVGTFQLGGHALFLSDSTSQMGRGESVADTAGVLSRMVDGIMIRTFAHEEAVEFGRRSTIPVINGLTDLLHPCQIMADLQTAQEEFGRELSGLRVAWIGDGNNMANSWLNAAALFGFELRLSCPRGYEPNRNIFERAKAKTTVTMFEDPEEAVRGAHVVNTDVWASMGQEADAETRMLAFRGFTVDSDFMKLAAPDAIFLHCLPAHRGEEVAGAVIDGPQSRVWDQAE